MVVWRNTNFRYKESRMNTLIFVLTHFAPGALIALFFLFLLAADWCERHPGRQAKLAFLFLVGIHLWATFITIGLAVCALPEMSMSPFKAASICNFSVCISTLLHIIAWFKVQAANNP